MSKKIESVHLSIIIPAYNEEKRLPKTIRKIEEFMKSAPYTWEILVVDDGSKDGTVRVAQKALSKEIGRVICNPRNMGKGASIRNGMEKARGKYRLFSDADLSTPIEELNKLMKAMKSGKYDIAIASRAMKASKLEKRQPIYRETMGRIFNLIVQVFALPGIKDSQCGFKIFTRESAEFIFPRQTRQGFSFDVEILYIARLGGFRIVEVPVRWIDSPASRVNPIKDSALMFLDVLRIRWRGRQYLTR